MNQKVKNFYRTLPITLLLLSAAVGLAVERSYWIDPMVRQYVHHSELNRRWAWALMAKI